MSLQLAAQHMASRGRGPDSTLVHMAPQEVAGLQALAKAHGGSLTINPDTGLPEAGFLSSILPMVIGAGLSVASGGTLTPFMAAAMTGAGYGVATGSLQKGLMAGMGAYGGAGLAGGLMSAGAAGAAEAGAAGAAEAGLAGIAPGIEGTTAAMSGGFGGGSALAGTEAAGAALGTEGTTAAMSGGFGGGSALAEAVPAATPIQAQQAVMNAAPQTVTKMAPTFSDNLSRMGQGFQNLGREAGRDAFMSKAGVDGAGGLLKYGYAAGMPLLMQEPKQQAAKAKEEPYRYSYAPGRVSDPQAGYTGAYTGERTYFNPVYTRTAAGGGLMDLGPIGNMSQANEAQMTPAYARGGSSDVGVDPYTGAENFAEGGDTKAVKPVEQDPYYTMSGQSGDAFKYLMGQMPTSPRAPAPVAPTASDGFDLFGGDVTGIATPEGVVDATTGAVKPWSASNPKPVGGGFFGSTAPSGLMGKVMSLINPSAGGEWVEESSGLTKPYTFDPATGTFTAVAPKKVWQPYESAPVTSPWYESYGGFGGFGASGSAGPASAPGEGGGMSNSGEGGGAAGEGGWAAGGIASLAQGGQSHLGDYSDGGRLLRGPGNGTSDDIPASIGDKRPARLADGEFVIPSRIVSELGNGSTEAGARQLYAMMDRVQKARTKTTGKNKVAFDAKARNQLPA